MKLEQYNSDPEESSSDAESIADADDLLVNQVMESQGNMQVGGPLGGYVPSLVGPGGIDYAGQNIVLAQKPGGNEICMFVEGDPALQEFLSQPHESKQNDSVDSENGVCDSNLSGEDSKKQDEQEGVDPDENDSKEN